MLTSQLLFTNFLLQLTRYSKQAFFFVMMVLLIVAIVDPNMTVLANPASSTGG